MSIDSNLEIESLLGSTQGATGADIKVMCTEAGMFAIRESRTSVTQKDFQKAIAKLQARGKDGQKTPSGIYG